MDTLHAEVPKLAAGAGVDGREFGGSVGTGVLLLLATETGGGLRRGLVLGLVLLHGQMLSVLRCRGQRSIAEDDGVAYLVTLLILVATGRAAAHLRLIRTLDRRQHAVLGALLATAATHHGSDCSGAAEDGGVAESGAESDAGVGRLRGGWRRAVRVGG